MERGRRQSEPRVKSNYDNVTFCLRNKSLAVTLASISASNNLSQDAAGPALGTKFYLWPNIEMLVALSKKDSFLIIIWKKFKLLMIGWLAELLSEGLVHS